MPLDNAAPMPATLPAIIRRPFRMRTFDIYSLNGGMPDIEPSARKPQASYASPLPGFEPSVWTLADVLAKLRGRIGRTVLLNHIRRPPTYGDRPTHLRSVRKLLWRPCDFDNLLESLAPRCPAAHSLGHAQQLLLHPDVRGLMV